VIGGMDIITAPLEHNDFIAMIRHFFGDQTAGESAADNAYVRVSFHCPFLSDR
jgi:hypothetical protein